MAKTLEKKPPSSARAEAKHALRAEIRGQALVLGGTLALLWALEIVDRLVFRGRLDELGIKPRTLAGLIGIPLHPFLHDGFHHLAANTAGLAIPGWLIVNRRRRDFFLVWVCATLIGGIGTWLIAPSGSDHIGASGVVMGLMGFLVARGWFERRFLTIVGSIVMALIWGGAILGGVFPSDPHVSWQVHLFGLLGGILAARFVRPRRPKVAPKTTPARV